MSQKDWVEKDYYKVLGVSKNASADEIKKAFRKIARENHPDQNPDDKKAEARFKAASEASAVLGDPEKRKEYDETRSLFGGGFPFGRPGGQRHGAQPGGFDDLFRGAQGGGGVGTLRAWQGWAQRTGQQLRPRVATGTATNQGQRRANIT